MNKKKKCYYCKEFIEDEELVQFEIGKTKKVKKYAHQSCRENSLQRKEFFETLCNILDIPAIENKNFIFAIDKLNKKCYNWDVFNHALNIKKNKIIENVDKGMMYILGIIKNQLPFSYREIERKNNSKPKEVIKLEDDIGDIIINKSKNEKTFEPIVDISEL